MNRCDQRSLILVSRVVVLLIAVCFLTGCGDGRPERVPVSGQVMIDGEPLTIGLVQFFTPGHRLAQGGLDERGRFRLSSYAMNDGCVPGVHTVAVNSMESLGEYSARWHAPKRYADHKNSGLQVTVEEPTDNVLIEISWGGGKPFVENFLPKGRRAGAEDEEDIDL